MIFILHLIDNAHYREKKTGYSLAAALICGGLLILISHWWHLQVVGVVLVVVVLILLSTNGGESSRNHWMFEYFEYSAINCRAHSASLTDFGGVGDGTTSNTKAFQAAIDHLSQFASDGGSQLFVPPGRWLTGSFNLTSHFTLYLHKDAVLVASQVSPVFII